MASLPDLTPVVTIRRPVENEAAGLAALLQFESDLRRQESEAELRYFVANEARRIVSFDQMFILSQARVNDGWRVVTASSLATVDRNAPLIQSIERIATSLTQSDGADRSHDFEAAAFAGADAETIAEYPFQHWRWQPLLDVEGKAFAALIIARGAPLREGESIKVERIADTMSHAWRALRGGRPVTRIRSIGPKERRGLITVLTALALWPVPMTALAPVEVVAARPYVVAAPFAGVVQNIAVPPNTQVKSGQLLMTFDDVKLRNELALASEKLAIAKARVDRSASAAFGTAEANREVSLDRAELDLAQAEHDYAREMIGKVRVTAPRDGVVIYSDRRDWEGRAVNAGEAILQVADANNIEFRADLPAREQMRLSPGDQVRVWLDAQPLWAIDARLDRASYQARMTPEGVLAFAVQAKPLSGASPPRIGSRGTARIYGRWAPLSYVVFRRPIASLRQTIGF